MSTRLLISFIVAFASPLVSTLFPYTTLFRSLDALTYGTPPHGGIALGVDRIAMLLGGEKSDRKSTRLNSSHMSISYAVFCLKKKTNLNLSSNSHPNASSDFLACVLTLLRSEE